MQAFKFGQGVLKIVSRPVNNWFLHYANSIEQCFIGRAPNFDSKCYVRVYHVLSLHTHFLIVLQKIVSEQLL